MEVFDNDLENYLNRLDRQEQETEDETLTCDLHGTSNCCNAPMYDDTDVCSQCIEHCDDTCNDCELFAECNNDNKPLIQL